MADRLFVGVRFLISFCGCLYKCRNQRMNYFPQPGAFGLKSRTDKKG
jgi:hypothetical protein